MSAYGPGDKVCLPNSAASHTVVATNDNHKTVSVFDHSDGRVRKVPEASLGSPAAQKAANDAYDKVVSGDVTPSTVVDLHRKAAALRTSRPTSV